MTNQHTVKQFDVELENIRSRVMQMGGLVEQQLSQAMQALDSADLILAEQVVLNDRRVNLQEVELDEACTHIIARRQPTAVDLRMVMTVIKTITDLERIGDEAKKIAKKALVLHGAEQLVVPHLDLRPLAEITITMLRRSLDSFARVDVSSAADVVRQDKEVDAGFKGAMRQLITYMMEDPRTISRALDLIFVAKSIERIGDHAKNISEYVVYLAKGRDVRHVGIEEMEREIAQ